jgi:hypothetical protein
VVLLERASATEAVKATAARIPIRQGAFERTRMAFVFSWLEWKAGTN